MIKCVRAGCVRVRSENGVAIARSNPAAVTVENTNKYRCMAAGDHELESAADANDEHMYSLHTLET